MTLPMQLVISKLIPSASGGLIIMPSLGVYLDGAIIATGMRTQLGVLLINRLTYNCSPARRAIPVSANMAENPEFAFLLDRPLAHSFLTFFFLYTLLFEEISF